MKRTSLTIAGAAICVLLVSGHWAAFGQMGGGFFGGGGAAPTPNERDKLLDEMSAKPRVWAKPKGPTPDWLDCGRKHLASIEQVRAKLAEQIEPEDIPAVPLYQVIKKLGDQYEIPIHVSERALSEAGIQQEEPVTLQTRGTIRHALRLILEPLQLAYIIKEGSIEITTQDAALQSPSLGFYDLSYIVPDSSNLKAIVLAIEGTIEPNEWVATGGQSRIIVVDNLLIISATEKAHIGIEALLARLAPEDEVNEKKANDKGPKIEPANKGTNLPKVNPVPPGNNPFNSGPAKTGNEDPFSAQSSPGSEDPFR